MLDLFTDALGGLFAGSGPDRRRGRSNFGEELVWTLALFVFPPLDFFLVASVIDVNENFTLTLLLPVGLAVVTYGLARRFSARTGWTIASTSVCLLFCLMASFVASIFAGF